MQRHPCPGSSKDAQDTNTSSLLRKKSLPIYWPQRETVWKGRKDNLPHSGHLYTSRGRDGGTASITSEANNHQDLPTGRGGDPPGLSTSSGSSQSAQVSSLDEYVGITGNLQNSLSLATEGAERAERDAEAEWENCLVDHLRMEQSTHTTPPVPQQ